MDVDSGMASFARSRLKLARTADSSAEIPHLVLLPDTSKHIFELC